MNEAPTFRCGWRIQRHPGNPGPFPPPPIVVRRGEWKAYIQPCDFDDLTDDEFGAWMSLMYRDGAFERLQQDLDILARQLLGQLEQNLGLAPTDVPFDDVKGALYRYQKAKRDTPEAAA